MTDDTMSDAASDDDASDDLHVREEGRGTRLADYWPLIALVVTAALAAWAIAQGFGPATMTTAMHAYMGVFLIVFGLLKAFDLESFAERFEMYDLLAMRVRAWGYVYPFVEIGLGLAYLAFLAPVAIYAATVALFLFGAAGVVLALREGLDIECPCMGNVLSAPLSTVTLTEDLVMVAMAAVLLVA